MATGKKGPAKKSVKGNGRTTKPPEPVVAPAEPVVAPAATVISPITVREIRALQDEKTRLNKRLKDLETEIETRSEPVIAAIEAGVPLGIGCPNVIVYVDPTRRPKWKDVACNLAEKFLGIKPEVYEAQVMSETPAGGKKSLKINGDVKPK